MELFKRRPKLTRSQIRKSKPSRNPKVSFDGQDDGGVLLTIPLASRGGAYRLVGRFAGTPKEKQVELEPVGAFVWLHCDGAHTVEGIALKLKNEFKITKIEAEASLLAFLETLMRRGYIHMETPKM